MPYCETMGCSRFPPATAQQIVLLPTAFPQHMPHPAGKELACSTSAEGLQTLLAMPVAVPLPGRYVTLRQATACDRAMPSLKSSSYPRASSCCVDKASLIPVHPTSESLWIHYEEVRELGRGSFARVSLVRERSTGQKRVCKAVSLRAMNPYIVDLMKTEIELLCSLDHPGVVKLYGYAVDQARQEILFILEYMPGGSCDSLVKADKELPSEALVARLIYQLLVTLDYCHSQGYAHRDIKPENIMLTRRASLRGTPGCKLIDFGLAGRDGPGHAMNGFIGTPAYMAPEVARQQHDTSRAYSSLADMWSVGATAFELLSGRKPFGACNKSDSMRDPNQLALDQILQYRGFEEIASGLRHRSAKARDFVRQLLNRDPEMRLTAAQALEHPWLAGYHQPEAPPLTNAMRQSLADYAAAQPVERCCSLIIACRLGAPDLEHLGATFLGADSDGDGKLSREDLAQALGSKPMSWLWDPAVPLDVDRIFRAANIDHKGKMGYTEFVAACTYASRGTPEELVRQAFHALDSNSDGLVDLADARGLFEGRHSDMLSSLPQNRPFDLAEWSACVEAHRRGRRQPATAKGPRHRRVASCM